MISILKFGGRIMAKKDRRRFAPMIFILLLAPAMGELLIGSSPPREYFNPFSFIVMTVLYGGGALLIREARARWKLGWSVIFLAIAYGIIEEGIMVQSFFNHHHPDLGEIAFYGRWLGTNWPWTIQLILYHATVSTMVPIMASDVLFPEMKDEPLLEKKGIIAWNVAITIDVIIFAVYVFFEYRNIDNPYILNPWHIIVSIIITAVLIYLAYIFRAKKRMEVKRKVRSPFTFFLLAFFFQWINLVLPYFAIPAFVCVILQIIFSALSIYLIMKQVYNKDITYKHKIALFSGTIVAMALLAEFDYFSTLDFSMAIVGILAVALLFVYRYFGKKANDLKAAG
jgi:hypothetical protein